MKNNKYVLGVIVLVAVASVIWYANRTIEKEMTDLPPTPIVEGQGNITSNTWVWEETLLNDGSVVSPKKEGVFTLAFGQEGRVSGKTDCNSFSGLYTAGANKAISYGQFAATKMFCEGSQEAAFMQMVSDSDHYIFDADGNLVLLLKFDSGSVIFSK